MNTRHTTATLLILGLSVVGCGGGSGDGGIDGGPDDAGTDAGDRPVGEKPASLSEWRLFDDLPNQIPAADVVPYEMRSPLFTDYAAKHRFIVVPEGDKISYTDEGAWGFPVGSILVKTFAYPIDERDPGLGEKLIETRLLVHQTDGWQVFTYIYNDDATEATRVTGGRVIPLSWIDSTGATRSVDYGVPTNGACRKCHGTAERTRVLGPQTGQLNRDFDYGAGMVNQIDHIASLGLFDVEPPAIEARLAFTVPDDMAATATDRARGYMDSNCGHCHSPDGETAEKKLFLDWASTDPATGDPTAWGVCKSPTSAGNADCAETLDIIPGDPDSSLMICRMELLTDGQMPPLGRALAHTEGLELVRQWITEMEVPGASCAP